MFFIKHFWEFIVTVFRSVGLSGVAIGTLILAFVVLLLVPLPRQLLDLLLILNFVVAIVLLLLGLFILEARELYSFPSLLLLTTLFRLSLNVSTTRLILVRGDEGLGAAGQVIEAFGSLVVQRDFIVGAIIFGIIAIVNFVVIAKGAARVAEVAARFALDALPGKQLAIDAELRAGNLSRQEADIRRSELASESQFYGSMDGAMKFVQGDALAGFLIAFINCIGGVSIGLWRGMDFFAAVNTFGVLTIGDGLVNIIPSLLISVCAGIVVTRVSGRRTSSVSDDIIEQVLAEPRVLAISGIMLLLLSVVPGLPAIPMSVVGLALMFLWFKRDSRKALLSSAQAALPAGMHLAPQQLQLRVLRAVEHEYLPAAISSGHSLEQGVMLALGPSHETVKALRLEVDAEVLTRYFESSANQNLKKFQSFVARMRRNVFLQRGFVLPDIQLMCGEQLTKGGYVVLVRETPCASGEIHGDFLFVRVSPSTLAALGIPIVNSVRHPVTQCSACWIDRRAVGISALERIGVELLEPYEYLALEVLAAACGNIEELFGLGEVLDLLEVVKGDAKALYTEVFDKEVISMAEFTDCLRRLVRERVNIRDLKLILEGIVEFSSLSSADEERQTWLSMLHSFLRQVLSRGIVADITSRTGKFRAFVLSDEVEEEFRAIIPSWEKRRAVPPLNPNVAAGMYGAASALFKPVLERGIAPIVLLCSADIRSMADEFFGHKTLGGREWLSTLAYEELDGVTAPEIVGVLNLS
ncbi:MAG: FHIPEP family type III secretion protein [Deltaproteobacteria bacterium]|nr:FHIPEP family type III secretion protein [Deltaproteobacteria bacterium]